MKKFLPFLFLLVLIAAIIQGLYIWHPEWFSFLSPKSPVIPLEEEQQGPIPDQIITEQAPYYEIEAAYPGDTPLLQSVGTTENAKALTILEAFIQNEVSRFKDNGQFDTLSEEDANRQGYRDGRKQELQISYEEHEGAHTVSYVFTVYQDTLGAHGNTFYRTFTFDTATGEGLVLGDLFVSGSAYLDTLTAISRKKLTASLGTFADETMIDSGTTAYEDNFQNWYLGEDAFVLLFPPYQVASYAAGPQKVVIPFSELSAILK